MTLNGEWIEWLFGPEAPEGPESESWRAMSVDERRRMLWRAERRLDGLAATLPPRESR